MVLFGGIVVVLGFVLFVKIFGLVEKSSKVISIAKSSLAVVQDANLDDLQKEVAMQKHAKELFYLFFLITLGSLLALAIPFGVIWLMEYAELLTVQEVIETTLSWEFIAITVILTIGIFWFMR